MAKIKNLNKVIRNLERRFTDFTNDPRELEKAAKVIVRNIKADSREGKGYDGKSFPSLSPDTVKRRSKLASYNSVSRFFLAGKANVTFVGQTINAIKYAIRGNKIVIFATGKHSPLKGVRGKKLQGSDAKFSDILKGLAGLGYRIIGVSKKSKESIRTQFVRFLRRRRT